MRDELISVGSHSPANLMTLFLREKFRDFFFLEE